MSPGSTSLYQFYRNLTTSWCVKSVYFMLKQNDVEFVNLCVEIKLKVVTVMLVWIGLIWFALTFPSDRTVSNKNVVYLKPCNGRLTHLYTRPGNVVADIRRSAARLSLIDFFAIELSMTLTLSFRMGQWKPIGDTLYIGNSNTCSICHRLRDNRSQNLHNLDIDL